MGAVLAGLGAEVIPLGFSEAFVPVDTEAIRPEDVRKAREWAKVYPLDAIVSADGDGDRPLVSDEGGGWLRGDIAGILCAAFLEAEVVVTPVSSNTALERCGLFQEVRRTRIGSPYVIEAMEQALQEKGPRTRIVGYEANGGFLTAVDIHQEGRSLPALPTRDALIVVLAILRLAKIRGQPISHLRAQLPERFTASDRLQGFPAAEAKKILGRLHSGAGGRDRETVEAAFGAYFGQVSSLDTTDGLRVSFTNGEIVHLRPSGNAPEFRCYTEADSEARAMEMRDICMDMMEQWRT
jgi:phosphomannomutase